MQHLTVDQLRNKLAAIKACTAIAIQTETIPAILKKSRETGEACEFSKGDISKVGVMSGLIGSSYSNSVNNQLGREDKDLDFEVHARKWGELMDNKIMVVHTNKQGVTKYYLQLTVKHSDDSIYLWGETVVDVAELKDFLPKKYAPKTQDKLETNVILRDIELSNIKRIKLLGEIYTVGDFEPIEVEAVKEKVEKFETPRVTKRVETPEQKSERELIGARMAELID